MSKPENIITVSDSAYSYLVDNYQNTESKNIRLIYRGVDETKYYTGYKPPSDWLDKWYKDYPDTQNCMLLTIAGRISPLKDFEEGF